MELFDRNSFLKLGVSILTDAHRSDFNSAWASYLALKLQQGNDRLLVVQYNQVLETFLVIFEALDLNSDSADVSAKIRIVLSPLMVVIKKELEFIARYAQESKENRDIYRQVLNKLTSIKTFIDYAENDLLYVQMLKGGAVGAIIGGGVTFCVMGPTWLILAAAATGGIVGALAERKCLLIKKLELYASERCRHSAENQQRGAAATLQQNEPVVNGHQIRV